MGAADLGTGTKTVMAMVVAEELGVPLDRIQIENADTGTTQYTDVSGGSKTVLGGFARRAVGRAGGKSPPARDGRGTVEGSGIGPGLQGRRDPGAGGRPEAGHHGTEAVAAQQVVVGVGRRGPDPTDKVVRPFATHFAEVEVNTRTGEMRVLRMLAAHDSGRVMNLLTYRNQVFGGVVMGLGFAMTERRIMDSSTGKMVNANFHDYKIPTAKDAPGEMTCLPIDPHDTECNINGAKGIGEPATIPSARPSPTLSTTPPAYGLPRRPSRRRKFLLFWRNARQEDKPC